MTQFTKDFIIHYNSSLTHGACSAPVVNMSKISRENGGVKS